MGRGNLSSSEAAKVKNRNTFERAESLLERRARKGGWFVSIGRTVVMEKKTIYLFKMCHRQPSGLSVTHFEEAKSKTCSTTARAAAFEWTLVEDARRCMMTR